MPKLCDPRDIPSGRSRFSRPIAKTEPTKIKTEKRSGGALEYCQYFLSLARLEYGNRPDSAAFVAFFTVSLLVIIYGGGRGIRTPDRSLSSYNGLANRRLQPLGHPSIPFQPSANSGTGRSTTRLAFF